MDELRGPNIQIVLHVKEGLGFGFLTSPFLVSGSLNGYRLETDPAVPCHAPTFDSELVWEADKRRFRNLRIQNVPVKVEVYTTGTQGRKDKVGYLLLSLLGARPCPSNKLANIKHTWHKLLGVKTEGKCCNPQLLLSLTIEDWINTPTPRNELAMFHSNEVATYLPAVGCVTVRPSSFTLDGYEAESTRTVTSSDLAPHLLTEEGLIQIGTSPSKHLFVLSFVLGAAENVDTIMPEMTDDAADCFVTYSVFTHTIQTDRFSTTAGGVRKTGVQFNQRTSLRLCTDLLSLSRYFAECPHVITRFRCADVDVGICSMDLRKLVPTEDVDTFLQSFCNADKAITIGERCYMIACRGSSVESNRKPFIDIELSLKYLGNYNEMVAQRPNPLAARSSSQLGYENTDKEKAEGMEAMLQKHKSISCTEVDRDVASVTYNNNATRNTLRHNNGNAAVKNHNEIADMIRRMYESFTNSQERLVNSRIAPTTNDDVPCSGPPAKEVSSSETLSNGKETSSKNLQKEEVPINNSNQQLHKEDKLAASLPVEEREYLMKKCVEELEDWKEKQQEIFKFQLKQKEDYHLQMLSEEWNKRKAELENKLSRGIEQCRSLAADLSQATDDFRLRAYTIAQRQKKLLQAKQTLQQHFTSKFQELREASKKMDDDMKHQAKLKDMTIEELEAKIEQLLKENDTIKANVKNIEKEVHTKTSALTKDQTAGLIQELRNLQEKLEEALQSKAFFKEQWGRAVRELHMVKLQSRRHMLTQLQQRRHLPDTGLDNIAENEDGSTKTNKTDLSYNDHFYVNPLADTSVLADTLSQPSVSQFIEDIESLKGESLKMQKKPINKKINQLIDQRDRLVQNENPDEEQLIKLNSEIRNILLNCGTQNTEIT